MSTLSSRYEFRLLLSTDRMDWSYNEELNALRADFHTTLASVEDIDGFFDEINAHFAEHFPDKKVHFLTNATRLTVTNNELLPHYGKRLQDSFRRSGASLVRYAPGLQKVKLSIAASLADVPVAQVSTFDEALVIVHDLREREKILSVMQKAVSREIATYMLSEDARLGGELRECSILFADIHEFTNLSERLEPSQLVTRLNDYMTRMTEVIEKHGGVIDKFIGDAIMAIWGAPEKMVDAEERRLDADMACRAALDMTAALDEYNRDKPADEKIQASIGVNTGSVVAGIMGSASRLHYTVIGDPVNLSSRLTGAGKTYGVPIIISGATRDALNRPEQFITRELDQVRVKGKKTPSVIYELMAHA